MEEQWILQKTEFQILAAVSEIKSIYGIRPQHEPGESEVMYAVHEMVKKGILRSENGVLRLQEPYRSAFLSMKTAKRILAVTGSRGEMTDACFYLGKQLITLEMSARDEDAVRIGMAERNALYGQLCDRGFLPEPFWEPDIGVLQRVEELKEEELSLYAEYQFFTLAQDRREPAERLRLFRSPCNYWFCEGEAELVYYDRKLFYERLREGVC